LLIGIFLNGFTLGGQKTARIDSNGKLVNGAVNATRKEKEKENERCEVPAGTA